LDLVGSRLVVGFLFLERRSRCSSIENIDDIRDGVRITIVVYEQCMSYLIHRSSINIASPLSRFPRPGLYIGFD
jgi:hypothetical protein